MKRITYIECENCGKHIEDCSPPSKESYENAQIEIRDGIVLLPPKVVVANHVEGFSDSHAKNIDGIFCNFLCLTAFIQKILAINVTRREILRTGPRKKKTEKTPNKP